MQFQLLGWGPDLDPATPGVIIDMNGAIPTSDGFRALEQSILLSGPGSAQFARSLAVANTSGGTHAVIAAYGSDTTASTCTLFEIVAGGTYTSRGTYTASTYTTPVIFRQFDSSMFAAREGSSLRRAIKGASFTDATGAPSCALIESTRDFLIAFNTATSYDWHCCALGNAGDWTPSISTQSARGVFYDKGGPVLACGRFGESVLAWTTSQTWLGRYVGAPEVWQWEQLSRDIGCVGPEAVCETPYGVCWSSNSDIHIYDGQSIRSLDTEPCRRTMFEPLLEPTQIKSRRQLSLDRRNNLLWVFYANQVGGTGAEYVGRTKAVAYHFGSKKWSYLQTFATRAANQLQAFEYSGLSSTVTTAVYDSLLFVPTGADLYHLDPSPGSVSATGYITTGLFGDTTTKTMVKSVRGRYSTRHPLATTANLLTQRSGMAGDTTAVQTATIDADMKFPFRQTGRYHSVKLNLQWTDVVSGLDIDLVPMGNR